MKAEIEVLQPGLFSTIQDLGRFGFQKYGVPYSGVMDRYAMRICNLVLGNQENDAVLEITLLGPQLKFHSAALICISGADLSPQLNGERFQNNKLIRINSGDILKFGKCRSGFRSYIGIQGGFKSQVIMKSRSWYEDITDNFRLKKGMSLEFTSQNSSNSKTHATLKLNTAYLQNDIVEVYPGPEFSQLNSLQQKAIFNDYYTLHENSNRMAVQFKEDLENQLEAIITSPVMPGTIQLTPSGNLIALMRDCQTSGGYPRVLQLSEKGIQVLSQTLPGDRIKFFRKDYQEIQQNTI